MTGYEKFGSYLDKQDESFSIKFEKIEEIIGDKLPPSAYQYPAWWANRRAHSLMKVVMSKNWKCKNLDLDSKEIDFYKFTESELLKFLKNVMPLRMKANYQPIVIKTLLEKGNENHFSASLDEIKEKFTLLNFDRNFDMSDAIKAVSSALEKFVTFSDDDVSLHFDSLSSSDIPECLEICGQEIAKWHVKEIIKGEFRVWKILPGSTKANHPYEDEFRETNTIGIGFRINQDLTKLSLEEVYQKLEDAGESGSKSTFNIILNKMSPKDIIILTRGQQEIIDFGIVTSQCFFNDTGGGYYHRRKVLWLNQGPISKEDLPRFGKGSLIGGQQTCFEFSDERKKMAINVLLGEEEHEYFILRHKANSPWDDSDVLTGGNKYHFSRNVPNQKKILDAGVGTRTIWFTKQNSEYYFWGYGIVKEIEVVDENEEWNLVYDDFNLFERQDDSIELEGKFLKHGDESIKDEIEHVENFNNQHSMTKITKKIYEDITGYSSMSFSDKSNKKDQDLILEPYVDALNWKPNLILYGPPGTGKTYHASEIAKKITVSNSAPYRNFERVFSEKLTQSASVQKMNDDEYGEFVIESIRNEAKDNGYDFKIDKERYNFILEKDENKIHLRFTYSKSDTNDKNDCYCGIDDGVIDFLKKVPEYNRYIITVNNSVKNFTVLPYSIEQKHAKFAGSSNDQNWDPTGKNAHSYHIKISEDEVSFVGSNYDCKKFMRNIKMIFGQFVKIVTFHQTFSYEEFIEGIKANPTPDGKGVTYDVESGIFKEFCNLASEDNSENKYVIIIDEINRGNIAKIFGELITIIEKDKRGKPVTLAYSKQEFSVPKNIFIVGTMNTADQSLTHLDAALKRRFTMMEHYPDPNVLKNYKVDNEINLSALLNAINNKLVENNFRDGQIGHSYFMDGTEPLSKISELQMVFAYDIIPVLRDYFYDDESKLISIFGDGWFDENGDIKKDWQCLEGSSTFRENIRNSFGV